MTSMANFEQIAAPVIKNQQLFDLRSGNFLERLVFNNRLLIVVFCALLTSFLGYQASKLIVNTSFDKMLPQSHEFIKNYLDNKEELSGQSNSIRINVENRKGDIFDANYLQVLQEINDTMFLMRGVDRAFLKSLWTPVVRWTIATEEGFLGGPVMPRDYDGSAESIAQLKTNVALANLTGSLVANNQSSSLVVVPLLDINADTGKPLDYSAFAHELDAKVRSKESDSIHIHIDGFAQLMGDLIDGLFQVMTYFAAAAAMVAIVIYFYTRCIRSTVLVLGCSLVAVIWQLGIIHLLGFVLDPYSILVPFLVFAIGVSHGAQKMNGIMQDVGRGTHRYVAARYTYRRLFLAGATALAADAVGFAVLMIIDIPVIRELAMTASIGVAVLVFTNLLLLPVLLSYTGVNFAAAERSLHVEAKSEQGILHWITRFTERRYATRTLIVGAILAAGGYTISLHLKIGDLEPGASELRSNSRYNRDNTFITQNYGLSSDQFSVIVKASNERGLATYQALVDQDRLTMKLRELPSVQAVASSPEYARFSTSSGYEGSPKWLTLNRDPLVIAQAMGAVSIEYPELLNQKWSTGRVSAYLTDHKAETLSHVVDVAKSFADTHNTNNYQFLLAGGSAGIAAATNITVERANRTMLYLVYAAVIALCFITFRSWRAVIVAVVPLALTSILAEALMVLLGIGVKVSTLPVIALGVGIGVDYSLYLLSVQLAHQRAGVPLKEAYRQAVGFTGKVVALVGITLAAGVITWAFSPIKFQADMGILLTFMFVWNMIGALIGIPALSSFLLRDSDFKLDKLSATNTTATV
jgi:hypothetical protein